MSDDDMAEAEDVKAHIRHGIINTDDLAQQDEVPNIERQAAETLSLPEVSQSLRGSQPALVHSLGMNFIPLQA